MASQLQTLTQQNVVIFPTVMPQSLADAAEDAGASIEQLEAFKAALPATGIVDWKLGESANMQNVDYSSLRWNRCAIVGSSEDLLNHRYGAEIDAHDAVFRFDDEVVGPGVINTQVSRRADFDYRGHVGSKSTVRLTDWQTYQKVLSAGEKRAEADWWITFADLSELLESYADTMKKFPSNTSFELVDEDIQQEIQEFIFFATGLSVEPTKQLMGVVTALHLCNTTDLYGFLPSTKTNQTLSDTPTTLSETEDGRRDAYDIQQELRLYEALATPESAASSRDSGKLQLLGFAGPSDLMNC